MSGAVSPWICHRCLRSRSSRSRTVVPAVTAHLRRKISSTSGYSQDHGSRNNGPESKDSVIDEKEEGAMSRRLSGMAEASIDSGDRSARKAVEEAGFSEELKKQLEDRIAGAAFRSQNPQALAEVDMPSAAGAGTRATAAAQAWTGQESIQDSALRMLDDSHKRLRAPIKAPRVPSSANLRPAPKAKAASAGARLANARDKTSIYALSQQNDMTEKEREQMRKELKDRFTPGARPMPTSLQGLTSLANERIEDAIARGQFKNLPRGKGKHTERDHNANSPFLDTTEYFMNKIIQKQEIVPPWIEKQQELVKAAETFRKRLRNDWKRHAARTIASQGGNLENQIKRATAYALAEELINPMKPKKETLSRIDLQGNISTVTVEEKPPVNQQIGHVSSCGSSPETTITVTESVPETPANTTKAFSEALTEPSQPSDSQTAISSLLPAPHPFRDPAWETAEHAYHTLAITDLNTQTRSYNLQAPKLAQKPYFNLQRELNRCYADVAPQLPSEIRERATAPKKVRVQISSHKEGGVLDRFGARESARVYDEDLGRKGYGFKEFWRDLWGERAKA